MIEIRVRKLHADAILPRFFHPGDACADINSIIDRKVNPGEIAMIPTGLAMELPIGYECQVRPRSGLAAKHGVMVVNSPGTIDEGYRGEIKVIILNSGKIPFEIAKGMRIAQIAVRPVPKINFVEVDELTETERSSGGFGSTGN